MTDELKNSNDRRNKVLEELYSICSNPDNKAADRISAAKLLLENVKYGESNGEIRVMFDGVPAWYAE